MDRRLKIGIIVTAIIGVGVTTALIIKKSKDKKKEEDRRKKADAEAKQRELELSLASEQSGQGVEPNDPNKGYVVPKRNRNGELLNPLSEIKGKMLYPAIDSSDPSKGYLGGQGKATLRSSAEVNTGYWNNELKKFTSGDTPIGTVISDKKDNFDPPMRWFKVKLKKPCCGIITNYTEAWVRADVVTFRRYKKSSSFGGDDMDDMVEKYDTSYQLGADVFPHSNWMNPRSEMFSGMEGQEFEMSEMLNDL